MSDLGDSIGTVIEGGLLGRAVEPVADETEGHTAAKVACPNCGFAYHGHFCSNCGQKAQVHRSLAAIGHDIMHGVLHLDGKLWNTLPLLAIKPGDLTRRYIAGERAKFVSPMSMFLFTVFAMFAVFQMVGVSLSSDFAQGWNNNSSGATEKSIFQKKIEIQITELEKERDGLPKSTPRRQEIDAELSVLGKMIGADANALEDGKTRITLDGTDSVVLEASGDDVFVSAIIKKWQENPSLMIYKLQSNGYKFSWLLIPLSVPFLWLLFAWRRQFKAYDHAVFVTYSLSFMSLLFIIMSIVSVTPGGGEWAFLLLVIGAPLHLYKQLRYAYGLTRFSAMWRFLALQFCVMIVLVLFLQSLLVLGAF